MKYFIIFLFLVSSNLNPTTNVGNVEQKASNSFDIFTKTRNINHKQNEPNMLERIEELNSQAKMNGNIPNHFSKKITNKKDTYNMSVVIHSEKDMKDDSDEISEINGSCGSNVFYIINKKTCNVRIYGTGPMDSYIWYMNPSPFETNKQYVKNIFIDDGVTKIGSYAFHKCDQLISCNISDTVNSIDSYSFYQCISLITIKIPNSLQSIEISTFQNCSNLSEIIIPESVTFIKSCAFQFCQSLKSIIINGNISYIENNVFYGCSSLSYFLYKGIISPESRGYFIFDMVTKLKAVTVLNDYAGNDFCYHPIYILPPSDIEEESGQCGDNITFVYNYNSSVLTLTGFGSTYDFRNIESPFKKIKNSAKHIKFVGNITSIGQYTFREFRYVESIELPENLTTIGSYSFEYCSSLSFINIPNTVKIIRSYAFNYCTSLVSINVSFVETLESGTFFKCSSLESFEFPHKINYIGNDLLSYCSSITSLYIPETIEMINSCAFQYCYNLKSVTLLSKIYSIEPQLFYYCTSLESINIPDSVYDIKTDAFGHCKSLCYINMSNSVNSIRMRAFDECSNLSSIFLPDCLALIGYSAFKNCYSLTYINISVDSSSLTLIEESAFSFCISLKSFVIPESVNEIKNTINLSKVESIGDNAFQHCISLTSITIPIHTSYIGNYAFLECNSLSYVLYEGLNDLLIMPNAFGKCDKLQSVDVMQYYEGDTFCGIPVNKLESTKSLEVNGTCGENAFYIINIISGNLTIYGSGPMNNYTSSENSPFINNGLIKNVYISNLITSIGNYAFYNCKSLITIDLTNSIDYVGQNAFYSCISLSSITIPPKVSILNYYSFCKCSKLTSVIINGNITKINSAFPYCTSLSYLFYKGYNEPSFYYPFQFCDNFKYVDVMYYYEGTSFNGMSIRNITSDEMAINGTCGENLSYILDPIEGNLRIFGSGPMFDYSLSNTTPFEMNAKYVTIDYGVTSIGNYAFYNCRCVNSINIPESVISIGEHSFDGCSSLSSLVLTNVSIINNYAFSNCISLLSVSILTDIDTFGSNAFDSCSSLFSIIYKGLKILSNANNQFRLCDKLKSATTHYNYQSPYFCGIIIVKRLLPEDVFEINGTCGSNLTYNYNFTSATLTIKGTGPMGDKNNSFTEFYDFRYILEYVNIEDNVTTIGNSAFKNFQLLKSVKIDHTIESIEDMAFFNCISLYSMFYYGRTEPIYYYQTFWRCELFTQFNAIYYYQYNLFNGFQVNFLIPTDVQVISGNCSSDVSYIYNFTSAELTFHGSGIIPESRYPNLFPYFDFKYIAKYLIIEENITTIDNGAFNGLQSLVSISLPNSLKNINRAAFQNLINITSIEIPESVENIGDYAFHCCYQLKSVVINGDINIFGGSSFSTCNNLSYFLYKGRKTPTFNWKCFQDSSNLETVEVMYYYYDDKFDDRPINRIIPTDIQEISGQCGLNANYTFDFQSRTLTVSGFGEMENYELYTNISPLQDFKYITKYLNISEDITTIGSNTFYEFKLLSSIYLPSSITFIGNYAFKGCTNISVINISESVKLIDNLAFSSCSSLKSVIINGDMKTIGDFAFSNCTSLSSFTYKGRLVPYMYDYTFSLCSELIYVEVNYFYYGDTFGNKTIIRLIPTDIQEVSGDCGLDLNYNYNFTFKTLTILGSGEMANYNSLNPSPFQDFRYILENLIIEENVTTIGDNAFYQFKLLKSVSINSDLSIISSYSFYNCTSLMSLLYKGYEQPIIKNTAFSWCKNLTYVDVMDYYSDIKFGNYTVRKNGIIVTVEPSSDSVNSTICDSNASVGCLFCDVNDPSKCLSCNTSQFFNESVDSDGRCKCIDNYELNENKHCIPKIGSCDQSAVDRGCSRCYLYDTNICVECNVNNGFDLNPTVNNTCQCTNHDYIISDGKCIQYSVPCVWNDTQPVLGCKLCSQNQPNQCTVCDESKGLIINENNTCQCENNEYVLNSQGQCVPVSTSNCDEKEMIGCIKCSENNNHQCVECNSTKGFVLKSNKCVCEIDGYEVNKEGICVQQPSPDYSCDPNAQLFGCIKCSENNKRQCVECNSTKGFVLKSDKCVCENDGYEVNEEGICVQQPSPDYSCDPNAQLFGCIKCSENNRQECVLCNSSLNFNEIPNSMKICTCQTNYTLSTNGECIFYKEPEPVLSFNDYSDTKEIPTDYLKSNGTSLTIDTSELKNTNDYNDSTLYEAEIDEAITDVTIKNLAENVQITINNRNDAVLNVQIEPTQRIQLNTSNSNFPINLPSNSQKVSIVVDSAESTLEVNSINNETDVILGNVSVSKQSFVLNPKTNVTVEYINLFGESKISRTNVNEANDAKVTAKKVNLQKGSESEISNVLISEELNLSPNSVITIHEDVNFSLANFSIYNTNSQPIEYSYFKFTQPVTQFPNQIQIKEMESNGFLADDKERIILIHQKVSILNDEMCKKWAEKVDKSGGFIGSCVNGDAFNNGDNSVYATKSSSNEENPNDGKPTDKKGLEKGAIIGIVVACVVVVAVIVIVVIFVVIKKKNNNNYSSNEDDNNNDDDENVEVI